MRYLWALGLERNKVPFLFTAVALTLCLSASAALPVAWGQDSGGAVAPGSEPAPVATEPAPDGTPTPGGGVSPDQPQQPTPLAPGLRAKLSSDGRTAMAPAGAPQAVIDAVAWANRITTKPYRYGGGHRRFNDSAYDCSGSVSYALHGAGLLARPFDSRDFMRWGDAGAGSWITVYTKSSHAYVVIAGLRFDTSGRGESGPRWRREARSSSSYQARHFPGL